METADSSETMLRIYQIARRHIPEDNNLHMLFGLLEPFISTKHVEVRVMIQAKIQMVSLLGRLSLAVSW
jgi:hypothetical protein